MTEYEKWRLYLSAAQVMATLLTPFMVWYFIKRRNK